MTVIKQLGLIFLVCFAGEWLSRLMPVPFPASVTAMVIMLILLLTGLVKTRHIDAVGDFFLQNMAIFFIPAGVGVMTTTGMLQGRILQLAVLCVATTFLVFAVTAWTVSAVSALQRRWTRGGRHG